MLQVKYNENLILALIRIRALSGNLKAIRLPRLCALLANERQLEHAYHRTRNKARVQHYLLLFLAKEGFQSQVYQAADCCPWRIVLVLIITSHSPPYVVYEANHERIEQIIQSDIYPFRLYDQSPCNSAYRQYLLLTFLCEGEDKEKIEWGPLLSPPLALYRILTLYLGPSGLYPGYIVLPLATIPLDDFSSIPRRLTAAHAFIIRRTTPDTAEFWLNPKLGSTFNFRQLGMRMYPSDASWKRQNGLLAFCILLLYRERGKRR